MSMELTYFAVLGVQVDMACFRKVFTHRKKVGDHDFPKHWKHHPETGQRLWDTRNTYSWEIGGLGYNRIAEWGMSSGHGSFDPFDTLDSSFGAVCEGGDLCQDTWYFGKVLSHRREYDPPIRYEIADDDRKTVRTMLHTDLVSIPWDESQFGIHFFTQVC